MEEFDDIDEFKATKRFDIKSSEKYQDFKKWFKASILFLVGLYFIITMYSSYENWFLMGIFFVLFPIAVIQWLLITPHYIEYIVAGKDEEFNTRYLYFINIPQQKHKDFTQEGLNDDWITGDGRTIHVVNDLDLDNEHIKGNWLGRNGNILSMHLHEQVFNDNIKELAEWQKTRLPAVLKIENLAMKMSADYVEQLNDMLMQNMDDNKLSLEMIDMKLKHAFNNAQEFRGGK